MVRNAAVLEYADWLAASIASYEALAKQIVAQRPEKGRIVEAAVKSALRAILPGRFSIGTGFAIAPSGETSSQLDLVIYDAWLNAPVILEGGAGLFPIESIYGIVEVKSVLTSKDIRTAAEATGKLVKLAKEKRYVEFLTVPTDGLHPVTAQVRHEAFLQPRAFVFSVRSEFGSTKAIEARLKEETEKHKAHIHGLAVLEKNWFIQQCPDTTGKRPHEFISKDKEAFRLFCATVWGCIQSYPMGPAAMSGYLKMG